MTGRDRGVTLASVADRRFRIVVCRGPECGDKRDSQAVYAAFETAIAAAGVGARCELAWQSCFGRCSQGPNVLVREVLEVRPGVGPPVRIGLADLPTRLGGGPRTATALYNRVAPVHATEIVATHVERGIVLRHLIEPLGGATAGAPTPGSSLPRGRT